MASTELEIIDGAAEMVLPSGFKTWEKRGHRLTDQGRRLAFEIADWVLDGEERFGEDLCVQVFDDVGLEARTVTKYLRVARAFPEEDRVWPLPFRAYEAVTALPPGDAGRILSEAVEQGWNSDTVRDQVRALNRGGEQGAIPGTLPQSVKQAAYQCWVCAELRTEKDGEQFYLVPLPIMHDLATALKVNQG